jgi:Zn-dependent peptidase ImmA (M78 family)
MVSGVVGSNNRRKLDCQEFRGFALADDLAPLVFINGADSKAAQMFPLAHELAHIWLGQSAVSDAEARTAPAHDIEGWCNRVAAEVLVPLAALRATYDRRAPVRQETERLARRFKVSSLVTLRRMHDAGALSHDAYWEAYEDELEPAALDAVRKRRQLLPDSRRPSWQDLRPCARCQYSRGAHAVHRGLPLARLQEDGHVPRARAQPRGAWLMAYLLDANVFIAAKNLHYGFDFCPAFWDWLVAENVAGKVFSIEKVGDEVLAVADELSAWAQERGEGFPPPRCVGLPLAGRGEQVGQWPELHPRGR